MEFLNKDEVYHVVKQFGFTRVEKWSVNNFSDSIIGYLGEHLKLIVEVDSGKELTFFVKCIPRFDVYKAKYLKETKFFHKEYVMLDSLFEHFNEGSQKWRPTLLLAKKEVFIFEDVTQLGYTMPNNRDAFAYDQVKACVETIARFHAQSYIYEETRSKELERPYSIWEEYSEYLQEPTMGRNWRTAGRDAVIDFLKLHSKYREYPNYLLNVDGAVTKLFERALSLMKPHPVYRNVVIHRDLWTNNIFFKNENSKLHALIVDFQTVLYCSPMMDLSSFIYFNTTRQFRKNYLEDIINMYYNVLSKELDDHNINIDEIIDHESIKKCYEESIEFGISQAAIILPITVMNTNMREHIFGGDPEKSQRVNEVSRSAEIIEVAKFDDLYFNRVYELFEEIEERYIWKNVL